MEVGVKESSNQKFVRLRTLASHVEKWQMNNRQKDQMHRKLTGKGGEENGWMLIGL